MPVVSVMRGVLTNEQPVQVMPLGLAMITSAFWPKTSRLPFSTEANAPPLPVTSLMMMLAVRPLRFGLAVTLPPKRLPPFTRLLLRIRPTGSTLNCWYLLSEAPAALGAVMLTTGTGWLTPVVCVMVGRNWIGAVGSAMGAACASLNPRCNPVTPSMVAFSGTSSSVMMTKPATARCQNGRPFFGPSLSVMTGACGKAPIARIRWMRPKCCCIFLFMARPEIPVVAIARFIRSPYC